MAIYTKRGDKGETSLFARKFSQSPRVSKSSAIIGAIGAVDEANSFLGIVSAFAKDPQLNSAIKQIQKNLFGIGANLAGANLRFSTAQTTKLEKEIDKLEGTLPVSKNFILPGGSQEAALLFMARTFIRRAERAIVKVSRTHKVKPQILTYINRLSDYLFILARAHNFREGRQEEAWRGKGK